MYIDFMFKYKINLIFLSFIFACSLIGTANAGLFKSQSRWIEYKSEHFIVFYRAGISEDYIKGFVRNCERYYYTIAEKLGFSRFNFWLWDDRAQVFIYENKTDYLDNTNQPGWSQAATHTGKKRIETYYFKEDFFETVLAHELAHIIFREFIGAKTKVPLWFEEGVACVNEQGNIQQYLILTKRLVKEKTYIPLAQLERENTWSISEPEYFYPISASLVIFLLENYSRDSFLRLCRQLRDGASFYRAMDKTYGIRNAQELDDKFREFLR